MILIALAGVGAGAINAVVGSGTLITFPTLVALGYPPVTATMSNAVGLVAGGVSGTWGYRRELRGQWDRLRWQIPASLIGAGLGSWLLLHLPETVFEKVVPVLLVLALGLVVVGPRIQEWARRRAELSGQSPEHVSGRQMAALVFGTFVIGIYGGYFTAAQGIMRASQDHGVPIAFGVLTTNTADEAVARSVAGPANKGREAALAAVAMARLYGLIAGAS